MSLTNLTKYKTIKKYDKINSDISNILIVLNLSKEALKHFRSYVAVQEIISILQTNMNILKMQQVKFRKELDELKK